MDIQTSTLPREASIAGFMNNVYLWMTAGVLITAITAYITSLYS